MKMENKIIYPLIFCIIVILLFISCGISKPNEDPFRYRESLELKTLGQHRFKYLYYKSDSTGITYNYCYGTYAKEGNDYILFPDTLHTRNFDFDLHQTYVDSLKSTTRIIIKTDLSTNFINDYKINLYTNSLKLSFQGIKVDTTMKNLILQKFYVEIFLPNNFLTGTPVPSIKSILTKKILTDGKSNYLKLKIPVNFNTYFYKNIGIDTINDDGKYWLLMNNKKIPKDWLSL